MIVAHKLHAARGKIVLVVKTDTITEMNELVAKLRAVLYKHMYDETVPHQPTPKRRDC
jgi:hypothetical protein